MFIQANYFYVNSSIEKGEVMANLMCYKNEVTFTSDKKFFHKNVPNNGGKIPLASLIFYNYFIMSNKPENPFQNYDLANFNFNMVKSNLSFVRLNVFN